MSARTRSVLSAAGPAAVLLALVLLVSWIAVPAITPAATIDQTKLEHGDYPLPQVLRSGQRFFTTPYQPYDAATKSGDGYGEGPVYDAKTGKFVGGQGPRYPQKKAFYRGAQYGWPFLRLDGLDSQSCFECHNSIGSYRVPAAQGGGTTRKPGAVGGSAGSNSNAFINSGFPNPLTYLVRNPPHVFGTGYTQTLADEMTVELQAQVKAARAKAKAAPNKAQSQALSAKGLAFGTFATTFKGGTGPGSFINCKDVCDPGGLTPYAPPSGFVDDLTNVTGISCDIVVRPFQWKGIASSIRHFVRDALDFHFSMQAVEKYGHLDCDLDGKIDEMTLGNVSALTSFVTMSRPPREANQNDPSVVRGRQFFMTGGPAQLTAAQTCAACHVPSMPVYSAKLFIDDPGPATMEPSDCEASPHQHTLTSPNSADRTSELSRLGADPASLLANIQAPEGIAAAAAPAGLPCPPPGTTGYCIDLTNLPPGVPEHTLPRLPRTNGVIHVPLFSDLRTHDMGPALADVDLNGMPESQGTDVAGLCITSRYFLTRPLWGVADTGPWLHDGRALTLSDAILLHGGEAQAAADAFRGLSASQQQDVVNFLLSLYLPCMPSLDCPPPAPPSIATAAAEGGS